MAHTQWTQHTEHIYALWESHALFSLPLFIAHIRSMLMDDAIHGVFVRSVYVCVYTVLYAIPLVCRGESQRLVLKKFINFLLFQSNYCSADQNFRKI